MKPNEDTGLRITKPLKRLAKIEASKEGISVKEWVAKLIKAELFKRGVKVE